MKKIICLVLVLVMALSMVACANTNKETAPTTPSTEATTTAPVVNIASAVELLNTVWNAFSEDFQFPCVGGDAANMNEAGPGNYAVSDTEGLMYTLHVPEALLPQITEAASMMHMMNANTFTGAAYKVDGDIAAFTTSLKAGIASTQWMCGFPEQLMIANVGDYVVAVYGLKDVVVEFKTKLTAAYETAQVVVDEPIE